MEDIYKKCPYCAEDIKLDAIKCKHCGELLNATTTSPTAQVKDDNKNNTSPIKTSTILSIGLFISFFLPWFSLLMFDISGFNLPTSIDKFISVGNFIGADISIYKISYLIYLIPISSLYNIIIDIGKANRKYFLNEFAIGLFCSLVIYIWLNDKSNELTRNLSIGFYLTVFISIVGFPLTSPLLKKLYQNNKA